VSYHSCTFSRILLHTFAKCIISLSFSTSHGSQTAYLICIQLITAIVLHLTRPSYTHCLIYGCHFLLSLYLTWTVHSPFILTQWHHRRVQELEPRQMSEIWLQSARLLVFVKYLSIQSMNQGAYMMLSTLFPSRIAAKMMSPDQENPSKPIYIFALLAHLTDNLQNLWHTLLTTATASHHPWRYIQHSLCFFRVMSICYPPLNHWPPLRPEHAMWRLLVAEISHCRL